MAGVPAVPKGWMSRHGHRLQQRNDDGQLVCPQSGWRYEEKNGLLVSLDFSEQEAPAHS
jgi:UDP-2-acetamido-3-amino-2,3-dideoxy-glucuronate N-acetyltransferase